VDPRHLGEALPGLVERLVESYSADRRTHHVDRRFLPSRAGIIRVCDLLLELTYPGYVGRQYLTRHNISYHVGELLPRLWEQLCTEIAQCLCHEAEERGGLAADHDPCPQRAVDVADQFLRSMPDVRAMLAESRRITTATRRRKAHPRSSWPTPACSRSRSTATRTSCTGSTCPKCPAS
jgi:hypothetical protein